MGKFKFLPWVIVLVLLSGIIGGCISQIADNVDEGADETEVESLKFSRESTIIESSSELEDDTGYGFAYHASNAMDLDYSTAWCRSASDSEPWLGFQLSGEFDFDDQTVGIVPGFARDEAIYFQNNRIKTLGIFDADRTNVLSRVEFEDEYEMQFFEMPEEDLSGFSFVVEEVYPGSKYDDTCISEIDFWSEWVLTKDADAAYNYYDRHKADAAIRPVGISDVEFSLSGTETSCGQLEQLSLFDFVDGEYWWKDGTSPAYFYGDDRYSILDGRGHGVRVSAQMNDWAEENDEVLVKWVTKPYSFDGSPVSTEVFHLETLEVGLCPDDSLVVLAKMPSSATTTCIFGTCHASFYYNDRYVGSSAEFGFIQ